MNENEFQTVVLAALLHDIGKFYLWKEDPPMFNQVHLKGHGHAKYSADFVETHKEVMAGVPELIDMVLYHGQPQKEKNYKGNERDKDEIRRACIIKIADMLSSKERIEEEEESKVALEQEKRWSKRSETPLLSVFNEINLGLTPPKKVSNAHQLMALTNERDVLFPVGEYPGYKLPANAYPTRGDELDREFKMLKSPADVITILHLLYKYTWCSPSATPSAKTGIKPDISLYDHARTTAAIAACLYSHDLMQNGNTVRILLDSLTRDHKNKRENERRQISSGFLEKNLFLLLVADMFGIQNYIYTPSNIPGAARRFRGRSFYLYLLTEVVARYIIYHREIRLLPVNILYCAGGNFQILLPRTDKVVKALDAITKNVNQCLFRIFNGKVGFAFAREELKPRDFDNWDEVLKRAEDGLEKAKQQRFKDLLSSDQEAVFFPADEIQGRKDFCKSCGETIPYSEKAEEQICSMCKIHTEIGQRLPRTVGLLFYQEKTSISSTNSDSFESYELNFGDLGKVCLIIETKDTGADEKPRLRIDGNLDRIEYYKLNDTANFINAADIENGKASFGFKFVGNVVPLKEDGSVMEFEEIANLSNGAKKLGVLKMDVDNLGPILQIGLSGGEYSHRTISRLATLSRSLEFFFSGYIHKICERFRNTYIIYSGGDDLLIVGPWSEVPHLALEIYREFREYTCKNDNITLSAGIFICDSKFPAKRFAPLVSEELSESKNRGKNRCTIFGSTAVWQTPSPDHNDEISYDELIQFGEQLYEYVDQRKLSRGFLHQLLRLHQLYFGREKNQNESVLYLPPLIWQIVRNVRDAEVKEKLYERLITDKRGIKWMEKIKIPASYALLKTRR